MEVIHFHLLSVNTDLQYMKYVLIYDYVMQYIIHKSTIIIFLKFKSNYGHSLSKVIRWQIYSQDQVKITSPTWFIDLSQSDSSNFFILTSCWSCTTLHSILTHQTIFTFQLHQWPGSLWVCVLNAMPSP